MSKPIKYNNEGQAMQVWFEERRIDSALVSRPSSQPLQAPWRVNPDGPVVIRRDDGRFFVVRNVDILEAQVAEVARWSQPMIEECDAVDWHGRRVSGLICMARVQLADTVAYLIQAKSQPGAGLISSDGSVTSDAIEAARLNSVLITTSIQASFSNVLEHPDRVPLWSELGIDLSLSSDQIIEPHVAMLQDPGRFLAKSNLYVRKDLTVEEAEQLKLPPTHVWATREAIRAVQLRGFGSDFLAQYLGSGLE